MGLGCRSRARSTPSSSVPMAMPITFGITSDEEILRWMMSRMYWPSVVCSRHWAIPENSISTSGASRKQTTTPPMTLLTGASSSSGSNLTMRSPESFIRLMPALIRRPGLARSRQKPVSPEASFDSLISAPASSSLDSLKPKRSSIPRWRPEPGPRESGASTTSSGPNSGGFDPNLNLVNRSFFSFRNCSSRGSFGILAWSFMLMRPKGFSIMLSICTMSLGQIFAKSTFSQLICRPSPTAADGTGTPCIIAPMLGLGGCSVSA
mmetsp:Transcript_55059/g.141759  ORF Transcript_55059/g.141759 Transcript_55059/m.141759 type:complete len:264 (-) Transcript_55059:1900-2691(-)